MTGRVGGGSSSPRRARLRSHITPSRSLNSNELAAHQWQPRQTYAKRPLSAEQLRQAGWRHDATGVVYVSDDIIGRVQPLAKAGHYRIEACDRNNGNLLPYKTVVCKHLDAMRIAHQHIIDLRTQLITT